MSIINQMLQKLDQRRGGRDSSLPDGVRAVASASRGRRPVILALLLLVLAGVGGTYAWTWWQRHNRPQVDIKAVSTGKVPVTAPPKAPPTKPEANLNEDVQLAEIARKLMDETVRQAEKTGKAGKPAKQISVPTSSKRKEDAGAAPVVVKTDAEPATGHEPPPIVAKKISRESTGRIRAADSSMKSVTPQQQALLDYQKALSLLQQGRVSEARSGLEDALRLDQYLLSARQALASLLVEQKQLQSAEQVLQEGVNLNAEQYGFAMALARLQVEHGDTRGALDTLYRSLPYAADNAAYQAFLAALLQRAEQHKKAVEHYQAALRLAPSGAWQVGLGISLQSENHLTEAQEAFARAKASNELPAELASFVEQRLRMIKKLLQQQTPGETK